jgi:ubiquinone/menaquinone biosynthesis C-methylase UbiE
MRFLSVENLREKFYENTRVFNSGTSQYLAFLSSYVHESDRVLDIGAGPGNGHAHPLKGKVKELIGLDPDERVLSNKGIDKGIVGRIEGIPFPDASFDAVVSKFTLEHIREPEAAAREVFRILLQGGVFIFRTPNLWHYATLISKLTPLWFHGMVVNWLNGNAKAKSNPYRTLYRCNTRRTIERIFTETGFCIEELRMIEEEPSYLQFSSLFYFLGINYERLVNSTDLLSSFRTTIIAVLRKPLLG